MSRLGRPRSLVAPRRGLVLLAVLGLVVSVLGTGSAPARAEVPPPDFETAIVTVKVGSDRTGVNGVEPLAGVVLALSLSETGPERVLTCTSDADGDCNFAVTGTGPGGGLRDRRLWVRAVEDAGSLPAGWYGNPTLRTGSSSAAQTEATPYQFQTPPLKANRTYRSGFDFMAGTGDTNRTASGGIWQQSRTNPTLPSTCGLDVALILDLSGSVAGALPDLKQAAGTFTDALVGTPSRMSLFSFSDNSPASGGDNFPSLTSVSTQAQADAFKARWNGWTSGGGTNWDRGIAQAGAATDAFDVAVMITDGNPTREDNPPAGPGSFNRFKETEAGIFSANQLKDQGSRLLVFGVGAGASGTTSALNLRALSGPTAYTAGNEDVADYFQTADYAAAGTALRNLALGNCAGSISVTKQLVPSGNTGNDITGAEPAGEGWEFTASSTEVTVDAPTTRTTGDDDTGTVNFPLTFPGGVDSGDVTVLETQQDGYVLVTPDNQNAVCRNLITGDPVDVTNVNTDPDQPGFTVAVPNDDPIACDVYNRPPQPEASIQVDKRWVINGTTYDNGEQPDGFQTELELSGPGDDPTSPQSWGAPREGYVVGEEASFDESQVELPGDLCVLTSSRVTTANGDPVDAALPYATELPEPNSSYTVTNTVTCSAELSLVKEVANGSAAPTAWTLVGAGPAGSEPGPNGVTGTPETTDVQVTPGVPYVLTESGGNPNYVQRDIDSDPTTRPWLCTEISETRSTVLGFIDGLEGRVTVPLGSRVSCTAYNETAVLELKKLVDNANGGTAGPADWQLTATPVNPPAGVEAQTVTGSDQFQTLNVRPDVTYRINETGPGNYTADVRCEVLDADEPTRTVDQVTLHALDIGQCTVTNRSDPARLTLRKEVENGNTGATFAPADWTLTAAADDTTVTGRGNTPEVTDRPVPAGTYELSETGPAGYESEGWRCSNNEVVVTQVTLAVGEDVTCTIVNRARPALLTLVKEVVNTGGGTRGAADWTLSADGPLNISGVTLTPEVTRVEVPIGRYRLGETGPGGYDASAWSCQNRTEEPFTIRDDLEIPVGAEMRCIVTNSYVDPALLGSLTLVKVVDNSGGGSAQPTDWTLSAAGSRVIAGPTGSPEVTGQPVLAGRYQLSEYGGPTGYRASDWNCQNGTDTPITTAGEIEIPIGGAVTCVITNSYDPPNPPNPPVPPLPPLPPFPPLPPTGGPGFWPLVAGVLLVLAAGVTLLVSRLRSGRRTH